MKQETLEWPWELQSSILSDSEGSKSQEHELDVETVPSAETVSRRVPRRYNMSLSLPNTFCYSYIWAMSQRKPCRVLQAGNAVNGISRHEQSSGREQGITTVVPKLDIQQSIQSQNGHLLSKALYTAACTAFIIITLAVSTCTFWQPLPSPFQQTQRYLT